MKTAKKKYLVLLLVWWPVCCLALTPGFAQDKKPWESEFSDLLTKPADDAPVYSFRGEFTVEKGTRLGILNIVLDLKPGWHAYSQKELKGQYPTSFGVKPGKQFKIAGPFSPNIAPKAKTNELGPVEEFEGQVIWSAPIEFSADADIEKVKIEVEASGQVCKQECIQFSGDAARVLAAFSRYTQSTGVFKTRNAHITGASNKTAIVPGENLEVSFTAKIKPGWHVYKQEEFKREGTIPQPTIIAFTRTAGWKISPPEVSKQPEKADSGLADEPVYFFHEDEVTWSITVTSDSEAEPGRYQLEGYFLFQACSDENCDPPTLLDFSFPVVVGDKSDTSSVKVALARSDADQDEVMQMSRKFWAEVAESNGSVEAIPLPKLAFYLLMAFLAGLILNVMPCVLPVIGLKVMSFVQQAGENRSRILMLNLIFSLGLLVVFWILATLSVFFGYGWGDLLTKSMTGSIVITSIVFAFGLSMLGVWELPIPGLSGSSSISKKSEEEGYSGAFFLGILTTILATPCTGPFLFSALAITAGQPSWVAYLIFTTIGLGMALPYILIGFFPSLVSWLPRPGAWMNTFKQATGFVLMATVVFLMSSFAEEPRNEYLVAMMTLLFFISLGCWWIGRTSLAAEKSEQFKSWAIGVAIMALGACLGFGLLGPSQHELEWQQFSQTTLDRLRAEDKLVFIDFTGPG